MTGRSISAMVTVLSLAAAAMALPACEVPRPPNVVVIMTDDQTVEQMQFLPRTRTLLRREGSRFVNSFVNWPFCCPSRATFLTGQYAHNHGVNGNGPPPDGGYGDMDHSQALPVWLRDAGYATAHVGKYLNGYGVGDPHERPPGWTEWYGGIDFGFLRTYDYLMNRNGTIVQYGHDPEDYSTDVVADTAVDFIRRRSGRRPFFLNVAPLAVHREKPADGSPGSVAIVPAPRHANLFQDLQPPRSPSYNEANVRDKPTFIRILPPLPDPAPWIVAEYRRQAQALQAVDEMVERIYNVLRSERELADTVIIFTSDNGYFHGEHRVFSSKSRVYEPSIRVPLLIRGPGFEPGRTVRELVTNADLAPTIVRLAEATASRVMDGRSLLNRDSDRQLLVETDPGGAGGVPVGYDAVRTEEYLWVEYDDGQRELYDMRADPHQLVSRHDSPSYALQRSKLAALLDRLRTCSGRSCRYP